MAAALFPVSSQQSGHKVIALKTSPADFSSQGFSDMTENRDTPQLSATKLDLWSSAGNVDSSHLL